MKTKQENLGRCWICFFMLIMEVMMSWMFVSIQSHQTFALIYTVLYVNYTSIKLLKQELTQGVEIRTMNLQEKLYENLIAFLVYLSSVSQLFWEECFQLGLFWLDRQGILAGLWETEILGMWVWKSDSRREQSMSHLISFLRLLQQNTTYGMDENNRDLFSQLWRLEVLTRGVSRAMLPSTSLGKTPSLHLLTSGGCCWPSWHFLVWSCISPISVSVFTWLSLLCESLCVCKSLSPNKQLSLDVWPIESSMTSS